MKVNFISHLLSLSARIPSEGMSRQHRKAAFAALMIFAFSDSARAQNPFEKLKDVIEQRAKTGSTSRASDIPPTSAVNVPPTVAVVSTALQEVQSLDGCRFLVSAREAKEEHLQERIWGGLCLDGWATGPGATSGGQVTIEYEWVQAGTPIGRFTAASTRDGKVIEQGYKHPSIRNAYFGKEEIPGSLLLFVKGSADGNRLIFKVGAGIFSNQPCGEKAIACLEEVRYLPNHADGSEDAGLKKATVCKKVGCPDEWAQQVGPLLQEMQAFIAENKPQVDQTIQANTASLSRGTTLKQRTEAATLARTEAQQKARERVALLERQEAERKAERQRAFSEAKTARRPLATPNLDALIARVPVPVTTKPVQTSKAPAQKPGAREK